jgi:uncharacterized protein YjbI with pentapeptide repeats
LQTLPILFFQADLSGAKLINAVITGAQFAGTNLEGVDFTVSKKGNYSAETTTPV